MGRPAGWLERFLHDPWAALAELADQAWAAAPGWGLRLLTVAAPLTIGVTAARWGWRRWRHQRLIAGARLVQILPPPQVEPAAAEALWGNLAGLLRLRRPLDPRPHVSFELTWTTGGVTIGLWVPGTVAPRLVERAVEAGWPGARTTTSADRPTPPAAGMVLVGGELRLAAGPWPPLRTEHWVDPLRAVLGAAGDSPTARPRPCRSWPARPPGDDWPAPPAPPTPWPAPRARGPAWSGGCWTSSPPAAAGGGRGGRQDQPTPRQPWPPEPPSRSWPGRAGRSGSAMASAAQPASRGACEPAPTPSQLPSPSTAAAIACRGGGCGDPPTPLPPGPCTRLICWQWGSWPLSPISPIDPAVSGLARAGARPVPAPPGLPEHGKPLGDPDLGPARAVRLTPADACHHVHLLGATGSGKSTLIANLALHDITEGRGVVVIDPKGDLVTDLLDRLPDDALAAGAVRPRRAAAPPTLNPLEGDDPDLAVDHLVGILHRIYRPLGPKNRRRAAGQLPHPAAAARATLTDIPRLLSDPVFRHPYLQGLDDPVGLGGFWSGTRPSPRPAKARWSGRS